MQKQQVFKVKGMQRDASMANANGEFAYEILNMRLMPAEDLSGFSLTNEKGTTEVITGINGQVIGQCPTNDSLVVFTIGQSQIDYIYEIWEGIGEDTTEDGWDDIKWRYKILYSGNLNFSADYPIEALFNYETEDIQKVYWIDGINQLRCINIVESPENWGMVYNKNTNNWESGDNINNCYFDSVKEINSLPSVEIERVIGGSFTAGVIQYYITYFNKNLSESPIVYTSPLLYVAHDNRGANVNDQVSTAFKLTFTDLDTTNWEYMRIYVTHRTSIDATPEASIVTELNMNNSTIEFTDYGSNRTSIAPTDLYFTGGKFVKAGTMTVKDQVMFLGNLNIETPETVSVTEIQQLFDSIRDNEDHPFTTTTRKTKKNKLEEYEDTHYYYKNQLNNTESITHYKYGEKYRFGISVLDKYGNWSNPIWIKDAFIEVPPEQVDSNTLELSCPSLDLSYMLTYGSKYQSLLDHLRDRGVKSIKPLVVFPKEDERKVIAQGVVCPTVYNLKDRKENGPYAQASWFMRPNAPVDLWGIPELPKGITISSKNYINSNTIEISNIWHYSDIMNLETVDSLNKYYDPRSFFAYFGAASYKHKGAELNNIPTPFRYMLDDSNVWDRVDIYDRYSYFRLYDIIKTNPLTYSLSKYQYAQSYIENVNIEDAIVDPLDDIINKGSWVEFRHNYALRSKGWSFGGSSGGLKGYEDNIVYSWAGSPWVFGKQDVVSAHESDQNKILGGFRAAEIGASRAALMLPVNRLFRGEDDKLYFRQTNNEGWDVESNYMTGTSAYYVDCSIITLNTPEIELSEALYQHTLEATDFRIIGLIPLTATISDLSLEVSEPSSNPDSKDVGVHVVHTTNRNIGHHGFKGVVSSNAYFSKPKSKDYRTVLLNPWQTTGTIQAVKSTDDGFGDSELLKRKILSNLRYSASTYYFDPDNFSISNDNNKAKCNDKSIGWKPYNGSVSSLYTDTSSSSIIKLPSVYDKDLIYKGNIDTTALATLGDNNPIEVYPVHEDTTLTQNAWNSTYFYSHTAYGVLSKGASIKYKSSPHIVVAFKEVQPHDKWSKVSQEILPAFSMVNAVGLPYNVGEEMSEQTTFGELYEDSNIGSLSHQEFITVNPASQKNKNTAFGLSTSYNPEIPDSNNFENGVSPSYGWLWLGEIYREADPTFGGTSDYALQNNQWENGGKSGYDMVIDTTQENLRSWYPDIYNGQTKMDSSELEWSFGEIFVTMSIDGLNYLIDIPAKSIQILNKHIQSNDISSIVQLPISTFVARDGSDEFRASDILIDTRIYKSENKYGIVFLNLPESYIEEVDITDIHYEDWFFTPSITWTQGDTYYQRFDTLKTYAYSDSDQNSVIDITSFMVETRINIDGRTDRNRGQESNLQMSPTNFNLMNDVYSQRDNFFTYRILDKDLQARTNFPNQITWSLTKTAGATVDAWMNITLASVLDLDGTKGKISALKNFNNNIIAFQEKGLSHIMFNSRAQIATSEAVPIQIANTGKVDGQQYFTTDVGCQDKWNIVTTPNGLYFVDYFNKSIYKFNGQLEDISTPNGFRSWCYENLNSTANIIGYYDVKNKEVMYYIGDTSFELSQHYLDRETLKPIEPQWLGFSELTGAFSSFYTYPKAWFANVQDQGLWLLSGDTGTTVFTHQTGDYNQLLNTSEPFYGLTVIPRQDSNTVKIFNNVEFRADSYNGGILDDNHTFDTISAETEYQDRTEATLTYNKYRPSNLKKKFRTWRANIPRVNNGYHRFVNQWAKIGLCKMNPSTEKTILHDLSVWYSE